MAGAGATKFLFGSLIFYGFLALLLTIGDGEGARYLSADISLPAPPTQITTDNTFLDFLTNGWANISYVFTSLFQVIINPFSGIGFLAWLSIAIGIVNAYIIIDTLLQLIP